MPSYLPSTIANNIILLPTGLLAVSRRTNKMTNTTLLAALHPLGAVTGSGVSLGMPASARVITSKTVGLTADIPAHRNLFQHN